MKVATTTTKGNRKEPRQQQQRQQTGARVALSLCHGLLMLAIWVWTMLRYWRYLGRR